MQTIATIRGVRWVVEELPKNSHWRIIASLNRGGLKSLTIFRFKNGVTIVSHNQAPLEIIPVSDINFFVDAAIEHCHGHGVFPVAIAATANVKPRRGR